MKKASILLFFSMLISLSIIFSSCNSDDKTTKTEKTNDSTLVNIPEVKTGNFYPTESSSSNSVILADTIIYNVVVKNTDPDDEWQEFSLKYVNRKAIANIIFNAIYNGRLTPYNYSTESIMSIDEVKALEKEYPRSEIANIQFTEEWYFNENTLSFSKKVNSIMMAYERKSTTGEIKYKAGVQVFLNDKSKNLNQK